VGRLLRMVDGGQAVETIIKSRMVRWWAALVRRLLASPLGQRGT